jgi:transposase
MPGTALLKKELIEEHKDIFDNIEYAIDINGGNLFGTTKRIKWDNNASLYAHIYVDSVKIDESRNKIIEDFNYMYNNAIKDPEKYIDDLDYRYALKFKRSAKSENGYSIEKNQDSYIESRSKAGWFVLLSNCIDNSHQAIKIYRKRDVVEKSFDILKIFTNHNRTKVYSDIDNENNLFISFISLIMISYIHNIMKDNNIYKIYTIDELISELSLIKAVKIDKDIIIDPLTKKVKDIFDIFGFKYP